MIKLFKRYRWFIAAMGLFGVILIATGLHKRVYSSARSRLLNAGIIQPRAFNPESFETLALGKAAARSDSLIAENGDAYALSDFAGDVLFINKWATWCGPCIAEMPTIQRLYERVDGNVVFLMVSTDREFSKAVAFKQRKGYTFPLYHFSGPGSGKFRTPSIPATFVIEPDMETMYRYVGMRDYDTPEFRDFLMERSR